MSDFELLDEEELFRGFLLTLTRRHLRHGDDVFDREIVQHPGAVAVVAIDAEDRVVLLEQYRASFGRRLYEIPAGTCDVHGEDLEHTARRELAEEVGLSAQSIERLGTFLNSPGYCDQRTEVYVATDLDEVPREPSGAEEEDARVLRVPFDEALAMVDQGEIQDVTTAFGLLMAQRHRAR